MRYTGPMAKRGELPPVARKYLGILDEKLTRQGRNAGRWRRLLEDGSFLEVGIYETPTGRHYWAQHRPIEEEEETDEALLESGWVWTTLTEGLPGYNFYTEDMEDAARPDGNDSNGNAKLELDLFSFSDDFTWDFHEDRSTGYYDGMASKSVKRYGVDTLGAKHALVVGNSNAHSGKLQLAYQGWMGSTLTAPLTLAATVGQYSSGDESYGLLSSDTEFKYWLIKVTETEIFKAELEFTDDGETLKDLMVAAGYTPGQTRDARSDDTAMETLKYETLLLTLVKSDLTWESLGTYERTGRVIYYGFNFNWMGTEAYCYTHETVNDGAEPNYLTSREYFLQVSTVAESATITENVQGNWTPDFGNHNIWHPDKQGFNRMEFWYPQSCFDDYANGWVEGEVTIHKFFYDNDDVCSITFSLEDNAGTANIIAARDAWLAGLAETCKSGYWENEWYDDGAVTAGYKVYRDGAEVVDATETTTMDSVLTTGYRYVRDIREPTTSSIKGPNCYSTSINYTKFCNSPTQVYCQAYGCGSAGTVREQHYCGTFTGYLKILDFDYVSNQSLLIFPFNSSCSVFVGKQLQYAGDYTQFNRSSNGTIGFKAYDNAAPFPTCSWSVQGEYWLNAANQDAAESTAVCGFANNNTQPYNNEPWEEEYFDFWFVVPNQDDSGSDIDPIQLEDREWINEDLGNVALSGYGYLFNPAVCGNFPYPYYGLRIMNQESALYRDRWYFSSIWGATATLEADTRIGSGYYYPGFWEGWA